MRQHTVSGDSVTVTGPAHVRGSLRVPGDKSISHRALMLAGLAHGESVITGLSSGEDVLSTRGALVDLGVDIVGREEVHVRGGITREPTGPLDLGNAGTGMRLMAGICAAQEMFVVLTGDQYLRNRPMDRVAVPLREMGAVIDGREGGRLAPLAIRGRSRLSAITFRAPVASAQVKSAVLLAGLGASGHTTVIEPTPTRRHTEEMLASFGIEVRFGREAVTVVPGTPVSPGRLHVPGDPSQAAFWIVAGVILPDSEVLVEDVYVGPGRLGYLDALTSMGATVSLNPMRREAASSSSRLNPFSLTAADVPGLVDEVPILAVAAAFADGSSEISGAHELRVKESDRIASTVAMLQAFGVLAAEKPGGLVVQGGARLHAAEVDARGDHRIAMAAAVLALAAEGETVIHGWSSVRTSYPNFLRDLELLTSGSVQSG